jgi:HEAT repeat protein
MLGLVSALALAAGVDLSAWAKAPLDTSTFHGDGIRVHNAALAARCHADPKHAAAELLALARSNNEDAGVRGRAIQALGWLQQPEAIPALLELASSGYGETAAKALSFFGVRPAFTVNIGFGGEALSVVFPAKPEPAATQALLKVAAMEKLTKPALRALRLHRPDVAALMALPHADQFAEDLFPLLRDDGSDEAHAAMVKLISVPSPVRPQLAEELGYSGRAEAVAPLYALLGSASAQLRLAALGALLHLAGREWSSPDAPDPEKARALAQAIFGPKLDRFDAKAALRRSVPAPMVPEPTSCSAP